MEDFGEKVWVKIAEQQIEASFDHEQKRKEEKEDMEKDLKECKRLCDEEGEEEKEEQVKWKLLEKKNGRELQNSK